MMRSARGAGLAGVGKGLSPNGGAWKAGERNGELTHRLVKLAHRSAKSNWSVSWAAGAALFV